MQKVIFPGTFDPPTLGHLDIVKKAASIFDHVYVAIGCNTRKNKTAFSSDERLKLLQIVTQTIPNVEVVTFSGLLVDFAKQLEVQVILKTLRNVTDFDYENLQAQMNRQMGNIETLYMFSDEKFRLISSTLVREIASYGKRLHAFIPSEIESLVFNHLSNFRPPDLGT
jgi:pantetheine-phosphate adenylyltransferase